MRNRGAAVRPLSNKHPPSHSVKRGAASSGRRSVWDTHSKEVVLIGGEAAERPGCQSEGRRERGAAVAMRRVATAEDGEAFVATPAQDHAPGEWATIAAAEAELVEIVQDRHLSDQGSVKSGELGDEQGVEGALLLGGTGGVLGPLGEVVATARHDQGLTADRRRDVRATVAASAAASQRRVAVSASPWAAARAACSRSIQARRAASRAIASASADGAVSSMDWAT